MKTKVKIVDKQSGYYGAVGYIDGYVSFSGWQGGVAAIVVVEGRIISINLTFLEVQEN